MDIVDRGNGVPLVLVPGVQGRWQYMGLAIDALAKFFRVISFSLCGDRGSGCTFVESRGADNFLDQIDRVLDDRKVSHAVIAGVSFGALIALHYAAMRPRRSDGLVLVSTPGPHFQPERRHMWYTRAPRLFGPLFLAEIPFRVGQELPHTFADSRTRRHFSWGQIKTFLDAPFSLTRMAARARLIGNQAERDASLVAAPTLLITGERELDRVVPVDGTLEYLQAIRDARWAPIQRTGHLGYITRPDVFAAIVRDFVATLSLRRTSSEGDPHAA